MGKPRKWTLDKLKAEASKYTRRVDFQQKSCGAYLSARRQGLLDLLCSHMQEPATKPFSEEEILEIAKKFKTRTEFQKNSKAYAAAYAKGKDFLDLVCSHMISTKKITKHTKESARIDALKYKTRREWCVNDSGSYLASLKNGWLNELCAHMSATNSYRASKEELSILKMVQEYFPDAQKKIFYNKDPNFRQSRYELDIFIPSLNKGIEYDGAYWHSPENLAKSRKISIEQALKYHEEKDSFFKKLGIDVLHIHEKPWNSSGRCLEQRRILSFLGLAKMPPPHMCFRYIWSQNPDSEGEF
jgi:hypothetical protein